MFSAGIRKPYASSLPSVCVGNLTVGGTGKTPLTVYLQGLLTGLGHKIVLSVSGYGSAHFRSPAMAPPGPLDPFEWGDEAALLRWKLPSVPIVVGKKRAIAAKLAEVSCPGHVMLMDDGFQHLEFVPSLSVVLDPPRPNTFCLPAGPYR